MEQPGNRSLQFGHRGWLLQIRVAANGERLLLLVSLGVGGIVNNWNIRLQFSQLLTQLDPGSIRQSHIKYAEVKTEALRQLQRLGHTTRRDHDVPKLLQCTRHQKADLRLIVDMKDL